MNVDDWLAIYEAQSIKLIPAHEGEKVPSINWKQYEEKGPSKEQIEKWFKNNQPKNWAILCGKASDNLVVLDFDKEGRFQEFFPNTQSIMEWTWVVKTPHGWHVYLRQEDEIPSFKIPGYVEVRSTGNIVIAPPSYVYEKGTEKKLKYEFRSRPTQINGLVNLEQAIKRRAIDLGASIKNPLEEGWLTTHLEGYSGEDPPCIQALIEEPAPCGERDERAIRIAAYYANFCQDRQKARDKLTRWHKSVEKDPSDPFTLEEALAKVPHVVNQGYNYGCDDYLLRKYCDKKCGFIEGRIVKEILRSADILDEILSLLNVMIAGENENKGLLFLLSLSGKVKDWKKKQIVILKGDPGGGKTTLANNITALFKTKKIGRFSRHALDYTELEGYEILYLQELGDLDKEDEGISTLKFLSADDKGYKVEVTVKAEDGGFTTFEKTIPPITVITATTRAEVDSQLERRSWPLYIDETVEQTLRVKDFKIKNRWEDNLIALGLKKEKLYEITKKRLKKLIDKLQNCRIVILFPKTLFNILKITEKTKHLRLRGDYDKLWDVVWFLCFLMQNQMPKIPTETGEVVVASPIAVAKMLPIIQKPVVKMVADIGKTDEELFKAMKNCGIEAEGDVITLEDRSKIAEKIGVKSHTVYTRLKSLANRTPLLVAKKVKNQIHYVLRSNLAQIEDDIHKILSDLTSESSLALKFIEEAEERLTNSSHETSLGTLEKHPKIREAIRRVLNEERKMLENGKEPENTIRYEKEGKNP